MTDPVDMTRARELPAALLELVNAMRSRDDARKDAARAALADLLNS